jgi:hypothetical protein
MTRASFHSTSESVLEKTIFGSAFMSSPVGLREPGHAFAMSWAAWPPSTSAPVWPSSSATARWRWLSYGREPPSQSIVPSRRAAKPSSDIDM